MDAATTNPGSLTIVVELENASTISWSDTLESIRPMARQLESWLRSQPGSTGEVLFVHAGEEKDSIQLLDELKSGCPELFRCVQVRCLSVPNGRYYELKNRGIEEARSEIIAMLDSDAIPEPGWLSALLSPFDRNDTIAVAGQTYLKFEDFLSRTLALVWTFPLRDDEPRWLKLRTLYVNNCAFRAAWIKQNPFALDAGFKVDCSILSRRLDQEGHELVFASAMVAHQPLRGLCFLAWRAFVYGKDSDRRVVALKSKSLSRRISSALSTWYKMERRALWRVLQLPQRVGLPMWQVPGALAIGFAYYCIALVGQLAMALGVVSKGPEHLPAFAEHHS
jgi:glycosyltransferase involved in cell wall biosynthesis